MKEEDAQFFGSTDSGNAQHTTMDLKHIKTHPTFVDLLPVAEDMLENMIQDMRINGYYESEPIVLASWKGQEEPVLADGSTRVQAALAVGITHVPFVIARFDSEMDALQHVISLQTERRTTTDGALYRLCDQFDRLIGRGGDRRSKEAISKMPRGIFDRGVPSLAKRTAQLIGCNYRKVDRIRKIRRDGWPEIQEAVRNDEMTINKAYKLIRDMELGEDDTEKKMSAAHIKAAKTLLSEENFAILQELGGDVGVHVNKALEVYMRWLREQDRPE